MVVAGDKYVHCRNARFRNPTESTPIPPPQPFSFFPLKAPSLDQLPLQTMTGPHNGGHRPGAFLL